MELLTPHVGTIFWTAVTFFVILFILYRYGWNPILQLLDERERKIRESLETAEQLKVQAERSAEERRRIIEAAQKEAMGIIESAHTAAEKLRQEIVAKAQQDAAAQLEHVKQEIQAMREQALRDIRQTAVELSLALTEKVIGTSLDRRAHESLIDETLAEIGKLN